MRTSRVYVVLDVECDEHEEIAVNFAIQSIAQAFIQSARILEGSRVMQWRIKDAAVLAPEPLHLPSQN